MPELPSYTYTCRNRGCQGERHFQGAPPEWFQSKGLSTPTNCRSCKTWLDAQTDEDVTCSACSYRLRVPKGVKIMFHRNDGSWKTPTYCARCESNPEWRQRAKICNRRLRFRTTTNLDGSLHVRAGAGQRAVQHVVNYLQARQITTPPVTKVELIRHKQQYQALNSFSEPESTLFDHILLHEVNGGHRSSLAEAFDLNENDVDAIVDKLAEIANNTNQNEILQFSSRGSIVKVERETGVMLVINTLPRSIAGSKVIVPRTAFVPSSEFKFVDSVRTGKWSV